MFRKPFGFTLILATTLFLVTGLAVYGKNAALSSVAEPTNDAVDPLWCPDGVAPKPNANGCPAAYPNLYALIDAINNGLTLQPNGSGVIWVEMGPDNSPNNIVIDGSVLGIWANNELTL